MRYAVPLAAFLLALSMPAFAQSDDRAYCAELARLANRYIAAGTSEGRSVVDLDTRAAIDDCGKGNTAAGIPVLERKLRANGFSLPKRS
ncbi:MAG TPA: hypothetical protein VJQ81_13645 [Reyranella sp.]|jgi:hypothetical protein|nr:hypothetical protein [Reyranella sp.]